VAATLAQLDQDTRSVKVGLEQQKAAVDGELQKVEEALEDVRRGERTRKEEMDKIVREVESLKRDMPKVSS
jgi:septation ring formation regulator EzrA